MKALVFHGPQNINVEEMPDPKAGKGEVLLRSLAAGVCVTDKLAYEPGPSFYEPGIVLGHEGCGEIVEIGEGVEGWRTGEHIVVNPLLSCGQCIACLMGQSGSCQKKTQKYARRYIGINALSDENSGSMYHGLMADYCVVPAQSCYYLPANVDIVAGACVESLAESLHAVRQSGVLPGDNVVILGLDDWNATAIQFMHMTNCVVVDPIAIRRELATRLGADLALDPTKVDVEGEVRKLMPFGADVVFVCTENYIEPSVEYPNLAHRIARTRGTVLIMRFQPRKGNIGDADGVPHSWARAITFKMPGLFSEDLAVGGKARSDYQMVIDGLARGKVEGTSHVSKVIPFKDITSKSNVDEMLAMFPEKATKLVITME